MSQRDDEEIPELDDSDPQPEHRFFEFEEMVKTGQIKKFSSMLVMAMEGSSWVMLPKAFLRALRGRTNEAVIFSTLIDLAKQFRQTVNKKHVDGWFFCTSQKLERETGLSRQQQSRALKYLWARCLIDMERRGVPPRRWIKLNPVALAKLIMCGRTDGRDSIPKKRKQRSN